jgi:anti-sigma-K factor RskA
VTVYPLRCPTGRGPAARARAYLYLAPDARRWELAVHGLAAEPSGRDYQIWFLTAGEPASAGCFQIRDGRPEFAMLAPPPRGLTGVAVTIEPKGGSPRPTTPVILLSQEPVRL